VPDPDVNSPPDPQPLVLIPVTAEEDARRKWRIRFYAIFAVLAALAVAGYLYKRYTDPLNARESLDAGTRSFKIARYNQAILSFDRAVALKPDLVDAYLLRGKSYIGQADPDRALSDFSRVIELRPSDPAGWIARGAAYLDINDFASAIADATRSIALSPKEASAYNLRGSALRKSGDLKKALDDFNQAVALDPNPDNYYQRGAIYQLLGQHKLAIEDFTRVIGMIPDLGNAFYARAASRRAVGDLAGAREDHQQGRVLDGR
jgi:tetratricopeptide (TPR) repeat protein